MPRYDDPATHDFGEVRSLVQRGPSAWGELTLLLQRWDEPQSFEQLVLPYLRQHLKAWPGEVAQAPNRWKRWVLMGLEVPGMKLFERLSLKECHKKMSAEAHGDRGPFWQLDCVQQLQELDLSSCPWLTPDVLGRLMNSDHHMASLQALHLNGNLQLFQDRTPAPFDQRGFGRLNMLALRHCLINARTLDKLLGHDRLQGLKVLKLSHNPFLDDEGVKKLGRNSNLQSLHALDLNDVGMGQEGIRALRQARFLSRLTWLSFSTHHRNCRFELKKFIAMPALGEGLDALILAGSWLDDDIAIHLAAQPHLKGLRTLGLNRVLAAHHFPTYMGSAERIDCLGLSGLSHRGVTALADSSYLSEAVRSYWESFLPEQKS